MPRFDTPEPIIARVEAPAGSIHILASRRGDTNVEVSPHDHSRPADVRSANQARVNYADGILVVAPATFGFLGARTGAVDIVIELPSHSRVHAQVASADVRADGEYAEFRFDSASGRLQVQSIGGTIKAATASGDVDVAHLVGDLKFQTASGALTLGNLDGNVKAQSASGCVSIAAAASGAVVAHTSSGEVAIGIPDGTAGRLDIMTGSGSVTNRLQPSDGPADSEQTVAVEVRTGSGNVEISRAVDPTAA